MDKKMTKDEAEKAAEEWSENYTTPSHYILRGNEYRVQILGDNRPESSQAIFPFAPSHPEIGTTCKFSNSDNDDWCIGQLKNHNLNPTHANHFQASNGWWYGECEPLELIDPAEHAALKQRAANLTEQVKATAEDIQPLRVERDRLRREVKRLQDETIDPEEHAKAKEAEAVLAELLPVCEEVVEYCLKSRLPCRAIEALGKLRGLIK